MRRRNLFRGHVYRNHPSYRTLGIILWFSKYNVVSVRIHLFVWVYVFTWERLRG